MTVIQLLTAQPERKDKAFSFFGVFPFLQAAYIPYNIHLYTIEKRTSTLKNYIFAHSLTPVRRSVKRFYAKNCTFSENHSFVNKIHIIAFFVHTQRTEGSGFMRKKELTEAEKKDLQMKMEIQ